MSRNSAGKRPYANANSGACRELIEYRHSYYCFLSKYLPEYRLPEPSIIEMPNSPSTTKSSLSSPSIAVDDGIDLRLLNLDPLNWKKQDHYLLLGLQSKRYEATAADIKAAYRARVLQYHPDKLQQKKKNVDDIAVEDAIFKCIFHAYQVLSDPVKRKEYDSIDAQAFDDSIPAEDAVPSGDLDAFLKLYRHVFQMNARFSKKKTVPDIGHAYSPREDVEAFYAFWSTFESWRSFDYLDEDENSNPENRADKRWTEKKNKANRLKRKNEDNARLRKLFEQAYRLDPRMSRFREDDKLRKEALKMEKEMFQLRIVEEKERKRKSEELRVKEAAELAARQEAERKKEKETMDAKVKREKKALKKLFIDNLYFVTDATDVALVNERSLLVEKLLLKLDTGKYEGLLTDIETKMANGEIGNQLMNWISEQYSSLHTGAVESKTSVSSNQGTPSNTTLIEEQQQKWTLVETDGLIKAVKTHPGGLRDRWAKIAEWYNRHISHLNDSSLPSRTTEELIRRANEIRQTTEEGQVSAAVPVDAQTDYKALQKRRDPRIDQAAPTVFVAEESQPWTAEEQKKLEQGLKTCKVDDPARWEHIAELVGRSKKDCMLRAKEIAKLLKLRKA